MQAVRALILEPRAISDMPVVVWSAELREHVCRARCCILVHEKTWSLSDSGQPQNGKSVMLARCWSLLELLSYNTNLQQSYIILIIAAASSHRRGRH